MSSSCLRCGARMTSLVGAGTPYCSCGCAALAWIPVDADGNFPINAHLLRLILVGGLFFNQLLVWSVSAWLIHSERLVLAHRMAVADIVLAFAVWLSVLWVQIGESVLRRKDVALDFVTLAILAATVLRGGSMLPTLAAVNLVLLAWNFRAIFRRAAESSPVDKV